MNIRDIVNRDIVNLTNCESEPIHIPGSIQPHGLLLGLNIEDYSIEFCSKNTADFVEFTPEQLLGRSLSDVFPATQTDQFKVYASEKYIDPAKPFVFTLNETPYNTAVHQSGTTLILELEPFPDGTLALPNLYNQTRNFVSVLEKMSHLSDLCQDIANETRGITGYDRVMIYKFDAAYNGEVIAESKREDLESFATQKYPHTDIPVQARELYLRNPLRMIADIRYTPVPILTLDRGDEKSNHSLDLSLSVLRSVSPIHIEYLKNMGVSATLTISLIQNQKLWGLITCHHYSPKNLPFYTRLSALLQGHFLTSQIAVREVAEEFEISEKVDKALSESLKLLHKNENFIPALEEMAPLLKLANARGAAVLFEGKLFKNGIVPDDQVLFELMDYLAARYPDSSIHTNKLASIYPEGKNLSKYASGIIYHSMATGSNNGIIWLRPERIETINWAGNPEEAILINEDGFRLSPRKSFDLWREEVKNQSDLWKKTEVNAASNFAYALQKHISFYIIRNQEDRNRILNEELKNANKELANINWISTHDLKEPLRKIQIYASKVLDREDPDLSVHVKDSVERMRFSAEKMQLLIEDILTYSRAGSMEKTFERMDLNHIFSKVLADLRDTIDERKVVINADLLPVLFVIPFQIHQLFINLINNAIKFTDQNKTPEINIRVAVVNAGDIPQNKLIMNQQFYRISFEDNGIGFEKGYESRIFDVFQRLHPANVYPGTGIGLAICKKIVENHKGIITAESVINQGSVFSLYFPVAENGMELS